MQQQEQDTPNEKYLYRDLVLLYSPPKVGSTTIVSSIRISASEKFYVMHTHDEIIFKTTLGEQNNTCVSDIIKNTSIFNPNTKQARKVYVIDIYRQPIERKISEFFHEISTLHFNNTEDNILKYDIQKIQNRFNDIFPHIANTYNYIEKYNIAIPIAFDYTKKYLHIPLFDEEIPEMSNIINFGGTTNYHSWAHHNNFTTTENYHHGIDAHTELAKLIIKEITFNVTNG
jgi:hypothetical protein